MRIAVMGAGSIGGYFGGMLARAGNDGSNGGGNDVTLIARDAHLAAIRERGLQVHTDTEVFTISCGAGLHATDNPAEIGAADLILLTVKTYQNGLAIPAMLPLVGPETVILCLQNGIDSYQTAAQAVGPEKVLPGAAYIEAARPQPGVIRQSGSVVRIVFGEPEGGDSERGHLVLDTLKRAGIPAEFSSDIRKTLWGKFLFIATMAGVTSLSRETMAQLLPRPEWRQVVVSCMQEIETVARATGVNLDAAIVEHTLAYIEGSLDDLHASMHADIMAGRPLELEALNGAVIRAGRKVNVATPINDVIYAALKPYARGRDEADTMV